MSIRTVFHCLVPNAGETNVSVLSIGHERTHLQVLDVLRINFECFLMLYGLFSCSRQWSTRVCEEDHLLEYTRERGHYAIRFLNARPTICHQ